jgi:hypothetical protein
MPHFRLESYKRFASPLTAPLMTVIADSIICPPTSFSGLISETPKAAALGHDMIVITAYVFPLIITQDCEVVAMYETKVQPPLPRASFAKRLAVHVAVAVTLLFGSLGIGMFGYSYFEHLPWRDGFLNAAMLLVVWDR